MNIPNELPQFVDFPGIIIATGSQDAVIYECKKGNLGKLVDIKKEYQDRRYDEGNFRKSGNGNFVSAGSPYEPSIKKEKPMARFMDELEDKLKEEKNRLTEHHKIYLFCPEHVHTELESIIKEIFKRKPHMIIYKNVVHLHPKELLKQIKESEKRSSESEDKYQI